MFSFFRSLRPKNPFESAILDLEFAKTKSLNDSVSGESRVTFSRASSGTYLDENGVLQVATSNVPRFYHDPVTKESLGLLIEESRTNQVRNNSSMASVVTGSPGTLPSGWSSQGNNNGWTREVVGSGSIGAMNYVDIRLSGTTTIAQFAVVFQGQSVVSAGNGQTWASSVYHQLVAGSMGNIIGYPAANLWDSGGGYLGSLPLTGVIIPSSVLGRYAGAATISNASTAYISWGITFVCTIGQTYDFTIRFALPQLEQGAFASSPILTTGTASTRSADVALVTGSNFSSWYNQAEGTLFGEGQFVGGTPSTFPRMVTLTSASPNNDEIALAWTANTGLLRGAVTSGGVNTADLSSGPNKSAGSKFRCVIAASSASAQFASDGVLALEDTTITLPTCSQLLIAQPARYQGTANTTIKRICYWPRRLPDTTLQKVTR